MILTKVRRLLDFLCANYPIQQCTVASCFSPFSISSCDTVVTVLDFFYQLFIPTPELAFKSIYLQHADCILDKNSVMTQFKRDTERIRPSHTVTEEYSTTLVGSPETTALQGFCAPALT